MRKWKKFSSANALCFAVALCGCQSGSQHASLEQEARQQSQLIRQLENQVEQTESLLAQQDLEIQALREREAGGIVTVAAKGTTGTSHAAAHEVIASWGSVSSLRIHQLTSGLSPDESNPSIQIVMQPLDQDNELVKVAAEISISAALISADGIPQPASTHSLSITESRKAWTRGLVSSGFHVQVPLDVEVWRAAKHQNRQLLVTATLNLGADRVYTATHVFNQNKL